MPDTEKRNLLEQINIIGVQRAFREKTNPYHEKVTQYIKEYLTK